MNEYPVVTQAQWDFYHDEKHDGFDERDRVVFDEIANSGFKSLYSVNQVSVICHVTCIYL